MNKFSKVLKKFGTPTETAAAIGVTVQAVCFWRDGDREINPKTCVIIESLMDGEVTRKDLRPDDWQQLWPELIEAA
jgi:DNA-binding transcriptional regulator YdaS (Cro superfamily)